MMAMMPPMCGVNTLMNIVKAIVAPTFLYHSTEKSVKRPAKIGNIDGN